MIILYDADTTEFGSMGLGVLKDAVSCEVKEIINGTYEVEMVYPIEGNHYNDIKIGRILYTKVNPYSDDMQAFRIYEITKPLDGQVTVNAQHISYDAIKVIVSPELQNTNSLTKQKVSQAIDELKNRELTTDAKKIMYNIVAKETFEDTLTADISFDSPSTLRNYISSIFIGGYELELEFNNFETYLYKSRGKDNGVVLNYAKNIEELEETITATNTCDAIYPYYWKTSTTTSSGVNYDYQSMKKDDNVIEHSYDWLYSETSSGGLGVIKKFITSIIKSYIFRNDEDNRLYLWDSYRYIDVSDIDNWEMADSKSSASSKLSETFNIISPTITAVTSVIQMFSKSKEKMKSILAVFKLYYEAYSGKETKEGQKLIITSTSVPSMGNGIYEYKFSLVESGTPIDQNITNIDIYGDDTYGHKTINGVDICHACFIKINNTRIYCGYQVNSNLNYNNFLYIGPDATTMGNNANKSFFDGGTDGNLKNWISKNNQFIENKYMVLIYNAASSSYSNTIYIPRLSDTLLPMGSDPVDWNENDKRHTIYYEENTKDNSKKYYYYDNNTAVELKSSDLVYQNDNKWVKLLTVKGLDPAYPSTSGVTSTEIEKATLYNNGLYYAINPYASDADIANYEKAYYKKIDSTWQHVNEISISTTDARVFIYNYNNKSYYITHRNDTDGFRIYHDDTVKSDFKLPSIGETGYLYEKTTNGASNEYYIWESASGKSKWVKLTTLAFDDKCIFEYVSNNHTECYWITISNNEPMVTEFVHVEPITDIGQATHDDYLYNLVPEISSDIINAYKGCIILDKNSITKNNIQILPIDLTNIIDEKEDTLFDNYDLKNKSDKSIMISIGKVLLEFIKKYYINEPDNNPNKTLNETTISYMDIRNDSQYIEYLNLKKVSIGDTIHIRNSMMNIKSDLRIKETTYDALNNKFIDIVLGDIKEDLSSSLVTTSDGVSVLANDSGYTNEGTVNKIVAKNIKADNVTTETFTATNATIENLQANSATIDDLQATNAIIENLDIPDIASDLTEVTGSVSGHIITAVNDTPIHMDDNTIHLTSSLKYEWDENTKTLKFTLL